MSVLEKLVQKINDKKGIARNHNDDDEDDLIIKQDSDEEDDQAENIDSQTIDVLSCLIPKI